jgi:hypothetical protein
LLTLKITVAQKITAIAMLTWWLQPKFCLALPPADDIPEEILRTEIILEGRSPIDGKALSAAEYEELQAELVQTRLDPEIDPDIQQLIFLLQLRKFFKIIIPFY